MSRYFEKLTTVSVQVFEIERNGRVVWLETMRKVKKSPFRETRSG